MSFICAFVDLGHLDEGQEVSRAGYLRVLDLELSWLSFRGGKEREMMSRDGLPSGEDVQQSFEFGRGIVMPRLDSICQDLSVCNRPRHFCFQLSSLYQFWMFGSSWLML